MGKIVPIFLNKKLSEVTKYGGFPIINVSYNVSNIYY